MRRALRFLVRLVGFTAASLADPDTFAQTVTYALPDVGKYGCYTTTLQPTVRVDPLRGGVQPSSQLVPGPSPIGDLTLDAGGKYRLSIGGGGTYTARGDGVMQFTGALGSRNVSARFVAKDGLFTVTLTWNDGKGAVTTYCTRSSPRAQRTVTGSPNPGLQGKLVFTGAPYRAQAGQIVELDVASGRFAIVARGDLGFAAPSGEVVYANANGSIVVADRAGKVWVTMAPEVSNDGEKTFSLDFPVRREDLVLSRDGRLIAYSADDVVKGYRVVVRDRAGKLLAQFAGYTSPTFTPDGRLVMAGHVGKGGPSGLYVSDAARRTLKRLDPGLDTPDMPSVSPDGRRVAFVQGGKLWTVGIDGRGARTLPTANERLRGGQVVGWPAWSPDGRWIAVIAELDGATSANEVLVTPSEPNASKVQWLGDADLDLVAVARSRLSWR